MENGDVPVPAQRIRGTGFGPSIIMAIRNDASLSSMRVDPLFRVEYGEEGVLTLTTDVGTFQVTVTNGRLTQGWQQFTQAHNLTINSIVKFDHAGNLSFTVRIFDATTGQVVRFE